MVDTLEGIAKDDNFEQFLKAAELMAVILAGRVIVVKLVHPSNAEEAIEVNPVKYCNSLNFRIVVLFLKTDPNEVTAAASVSLSWPSPLVSQLLKQRAFTFASAKVIPVITGGVPSFGSA